MKVPTATCYYADWDDDGRGQGLIVLEDLIARGGTFGHSTQHPGIDGVATALEGLAKLHGSLWDSPLISEANAPWFQTSMRTAVDHDQVRIMWHWICENLRSEEHTSELQSLMRISYAVLCLNKKKIITKRNNTRKTYE